MTTGNTFALKTYGIPRGGHLYVEDEIALPIADEIHGAFRAFLHDPDFPCLGAKSIVNQDSYGFGLYAVMNEPNATKDLLRDLHRFVDERERMEGDFKSFIACFLEPKIITPLQFEGQLWQQLLALHRLDRECFAWAEDVSSNPESPNFSFSVGGKPFFVVGLAPESERWARRFPWPLLVFNDHTQFQRLREENRFNRMRNQIRERDTKLHGVENAMLDDYGAHSEARQYAGRQVGPEWKCPVHFDGGHGT